MSNRTKRRLLLIATATTGFAIILVTLWLTNPGGPLLPDIDITIADLHIARLVALPAVSGTRRELRVAGQARIADRRAQVTLQAATLAAPGGQAGDRIDLKLDAVPAANRLALTLALDAPTGGVIGARRAA